MANQTATRFGYPDTLIREYEHWLVLLREQQITLGSLVLCARSEATEFAALPPAAFAELGAIIPDIERVLRAAVSFEKINYLMLMMSDPNVHFHVLPRYDGERSAAGLTIADLGWPKAPNLAETRDVDAAERDALCSHLAALW